MNYYTIGLIPLIVFFILNSIFGRIAGMMNDVLVAIIVTAWSTALLISWKRKSNEYLYKWGSFGSDNVSFSSTVDDNSSEIFQGQNHHFICI